MQNAITTLRIQNFKSIKDVTMQPRRVNIIIGEPNVGKSNILEALSLLGGMVYDKDSKFMDGIIRYEQPEQLFYDSLIRDSIAIETDKSACYIQHVSSSVGLVAMFVNSLGVKYFVDSRKRYDLSRISTVDSLIGYAIRSQFDGNSEFSSAGGIYGLVKLEAEDDENNNRSKGSFYKSSSDIEKNIKVRPYIFKKNTNVGSRSKMNYLLPPNGDNLKIIIQSHEELRKEVAGLFKPYGLKLLLRMASNELEIAKEVGELMYTYPYSSIADTLQRLIFYLAAIESNDDAVLLFEEPEAHSFPSYIMHLAQSIVDSRNNQFFVVTHNPYLLTEVLEEMLPDDELKPELAIFAAYYEDYQTKVYQLTDEEMISARADGLDFFLNLRRFVPEAE